MAGRNMSQEPHARDQQCKGSCFTQPQPGAPASPLAGRKAGGLTGGEIRLTQPCRLDNAVEKSSCCVLDHDTNAQSLRDAVNIEPIGRPKFFCQTVESGCGLSIFSQEEEVSPSYGRGLSRLSLSYATAHENEDSLFCGPASAPDPSTVQSETTTFQRSCYTQPDPHEMSWWRRHVNAHRIPSSYELSVTPECGFPAKRHDQRLPRCKVWSCSRHTVLKIELSPSDNRLPPRSSSCLWVYPRRTAVEQRSVVERQLKDSSASSSSLNVLEPNEWIAIQVKAVSVTVSVPSTERAARGAALAKKSSPFFETAASRFPWIDGLAHYVPKPLLTATGFATARHHTVPHVILHRIDGAFLPGNTVAIIGSSGSGKSTLLNVLAGRLPHTSGTIALNDVETHSLADVKRHSAFIQQLDLFLANITAREHLEAHVSLRLPQVTSRSRRLALVQSMLIRFGLLKCADVPIGCPGGNGISGGERKRLSIATEMITNPKILLADEPTSGLDSVTALSVTRMLRRLASTGRTVVASLHQPSSSLFAMFDEVVLLAEGHVMYFGERLGAIEWFRRLGHNCPKHVNPSDFLIKVVSIPDQCEAREQKLKLLREWADRWLHEGTEFLTQWENGGRKAFIESSRLFAEKSFRISLSAASSQQPATGSHVVRFHEDVFPGSSWPFTYPTFHLHGAADMSESWRGRRASLTELSERCGRLLWCFKTSHGQQKEVDELGVTQYNKALNSKMASPKGRGTSDAMYRLSRAPSNPIIQRQMLPRRHSLHSNGLLCVSRWACCRRRRQVLDKSSTSCDNSSNSKNLPSQPLIFPGHKRVGYYRQLQILTHRATVCNRRDPILFYARAFQTVIVAIAYGSMFFQLGTSLAAARAKVSALFFILSNQGLIGAVGVCSTFPEERPVIYREVESGVYNVAIYVIAKMLADIPLQIVFPTVFNLITFGMMNLVNGVWNFAMGCLTSLLVANAAISVGYLGSATASSSDTALIETQFWVMPALLFAGFAIKIEDIPAYLRWIQYTSYFRYGYIAFLQLVFVFWFPGNKFVKEYLGFELGNEAYLWSLLGCLVLIILAFRLLMLVVLVPASRYWKENAN